MTSRIAVFGASGFVGGYVLRALADAGEESIAVSRRQSRTPPNVREMIISSYLDEAPVRAALAGVDVVVYLAGRAHRPTASNAEVQAAHDANCLAPVACARVAAESGVRRFVFLSSIGVHGDATPVGASFSGASEVRPQSSYAAAKGSAEAELRSLTAGRSLQVLALQPPLVYAFDAPGNFARVLRLVARGVPLPFGSIKNRRSFIAVENLADAVVAACRAPAPLPFALTCADDGVLSTAELMSVLARGMGASPRLLPVPPLLLRAAGALAGRRADIDKLLADLVVDNTEAKSALRWTPKLSLLDGLTAAARRFARAPEVVDVARERR